MRYGRFRARIGKMSSDKVVIWIGAFNGRGSQKSLRRISRKSSATTWGVTNFNPQAASDLELGEVEESLKWGEHSYSVKTGSPIRTDWKLKSPNQYYLFFNCQTKLIDTFRELHNDTLEFQGNRAIVLSLSSSLPEAEIKNCLELALTYQQRKHLPLLGA